MPDRVTMEAATPKCPVGPGRGKAMWPSPHPCGRLLSYDGGIDMWVCSIHGNVLTPQSLVHNQQAA